MLRGAMENVPGLRTGITETQGETPRLYSCLLPTNRVVAEIDDSEQNPDIYRYNTLMERFCCSRFPIQQPALPLPISPPDSLPTSIFRE